MNLTVARKLRPRIFYGWWIVLAAALINVYGSGIWFYGSPIFFKALLSEYGWGRAVTAGAISLSRLEGGIEAPVVGWLVDKFGPRRLAIIGALIAALGFFLLSRLDDVTLGPVHISALVLFYIIYAGVISIGYNTGFGHATMAAVANWFVDKRSRAFALYSLGAGGSGATVVLLGLVVGAYGWRTGSLLAGLGILVIVLPLALVMKHKPEQYGLLPDGRDPEAQSVFTEASTDGAVTAPKAQVNHPPSHDGGAPSVQSEFTVKQALMTLGFWMLVLGLTGRSISMTSVVVHQIAYLTDIGMPFGQASGALGALVFVSLVGRLSFGWLGDSVDKRYLLIFAFLLQALGILLLDRVDSMTDVWLFVVVYGISYGGAIPLHMAIIGDYYGRTYYATIRGFLQLFLMPGTVIGPIYAGWVFDVTSSYHWAFMSFIAFLIICAVFIFFARPPSMRPSPRVGGNRRPEEEPDFQGVSSTA